MSELHLNPKLFHDDIEEEPIRAGFGRALKEAGADERIVALCADLTESTQMHHFAEAYPERFFEVGIAEQNLVSLGAGMALAGRVAFVSSYAAFSPGRNWEQIRTTIALNQTNVKIVGSHAGVSVGPDGATHQMLEDIALMRVLPNMMVVVPCDSLEAERATKALALTDTAAYLRLAREKTAIVTTSQTPFALGKAQILRPGEDVTIIACGPLVYQSLLAAEQLAKHKIDAEVINCATVKPLDAATILASAKKTGVVVTVEEAQAAGGLGGAIAELLGDKLPLPLVRVGMADRFGESGQIDELWEHFGLSAPHIARATQAVIKRKGKS